MDMHTDTTSHLAAQAVDTPARAAAEMAAAMPAEKVDLPKAGDFATLMDVYDARNDAFEDVEEGEKTEGYDATADQARAAALAQIIIDGPCLTVVDAAAKIGIVNDVELQGFPLDKDAANKLLDEAHTLIWRMSGGWRRGGDFRNIEEYEKAAVEFEARYGKAFLAKGYRLDTREGDELDRARYLLFASEPNHPLALAKMIAALGAYEGYGDIHAQATQEGGLGFNATNVGLVGFVNAYRSALAMMPPPSAPASEPKAPGRSVADAIAAITAKVRAFEAETFFPTNKAHSAAEAAYFAADKKERTDELSCQVDELNATWLNAAAARENLIAELLNQTPSTPADILELGRAFVSLTIEQSFFGKDPDALPHQRMLNEEKGLLLDFLLENLGRIAGDHAKGQPDPGKDPKDPILPPPAFDTADLDAIVAEAKEIAKDIGPAQDAFNEANEAWTATKGEGEEGLLARQNELEAVWWGHLNRFSATAERLFDLPAATATDRARIVRAYADLVAPVFGDTDLDNKLAGLPTENLLEVISYLDGTRPKTLHGRDAIREAWIEAQAKANPELLAAE